MSKIVRQHGTALLWITHSPATLTGFADRIAVIYAGKIVEEGPAAAILSDPLHPYTRALVGLARAEFMVKRRLADIPGEAPDLTQVTAGCRFEPRCSERMQICATRDSQPFSVHPDHLVSCFKYGQ
jgi:peptide/nickel transport system ATP-binding protein